jgi:hypothetical protein
MTKLYNRYGYEVEILEKNGDWYIKHNIPESDSIRLKLKETNRYSMVDFSGGPAFFDNRKLSEYHKSLPNRNIEWIEYDFLERKYKIVLD